MKRLVAVLGVAAMVFVNLGCGDSGSKTTGTQPTTLQPGTKSPTGIGTPQKPSSVD